MLENDGLFTTIEPSNEIIEVIKKLGMMLLVDSFLALPCAVC